jgi:acetyl esterase
MEYVWEALLTNVQEEKDLPTVAPLSASLEQLKDLPPALIITAEYDVLRSEGELYAKKLTKAGVSNVCVRYVDVDHGFMTTHEEWPQCKAAIAQTVLTLNTHWKRDI